MDLIERTLFNIEERRQRILSGKVNCIPSPFPTFRRDFPGIEQGKFYLLSGAAKSGKSQIASYLFLFAPILYAYNNPDKIRLQIFYFPLEETAEKITLRFMSYLLYTMTGGEIRASTLDLQSVDERNPVSAEIIDKLRSIDFQSMLKYFEDHVHFFPERNPTGIYNVIKQYAEEAGTVHKKKIVVENKATGIKQEKEVFDYYEPKDKEEYVLVIVDHAGLLSTERGWNLKETIDKLSEYFMIFRNKYNYTPILIQQQNSETLSLDAYKANKIRPTLAGLADSKNPGKDASCMLGITNPFSYELPTYLNYNISKLRGHARFLEVVLNREGESNGIIALYFDGAVNFFKPLPSYNNITALHDVYNLIQSLS